MNIPIQGKGLETILFVNKNFEFYFDIFSASFYLITRYEEYVNQHDRDKWGRFEAKNSIAFQNDFLQYPIIHFWAKKLGQNIQNNYPEFQFKLPEFQFIPTFDIDTAFAFKNRSVSKQIVLISRDLLFLKFLA